MSKTATAQQAEQTFAIERSDGRIIVTKCGVGHHSAAEFHSYDTVRYSYHIEAERDGKTIITGEQAGFKTWEDALSWAQAEILDI